MVGNNNREVQSLRNARRKKKRSTTKSLSKSSRSTNHLAKAEDRRGRKWYIYNSQNPTTITFYKVVRIRVSGCNGSVLDMDGKQDYVVENGCWADQSFEKEPRGRWKTA